MPAATEITGVDFATVFVTDYPTAVEFYGQTLGLEQSADYGKIPGGEFETGSLTLQVLDAASVGREFQPSTHPIAFTWATWKRPAPIWRPRTSASSPRRWTPASATWSPSPTPTATS